ncbi:tRNA (guanosine(37)-N1)-methyltransferase TrmD [Candidatus Riesia pediculischaeffi]|uniref:tRNA (guanine-N(1)-)-methyltransferase n=2 Tax=Candidatus Riesia pediculischaeffi TaxID=428411 RepID=A0A1V0HL92_9ENTR|nr:tRNA (guanosine(37)-N1)-methyltransferase TrmD [Candidatus Riesia pediculischaeffi]ARC53481.1 tRNA (guanine-N1)-methyltransferase [Candidatus Riesia pediculischaeffi]KIE64036.1 tRNA (Guanine37-N1) -methyltransferase [Candidatus Riesia pediculischaeffi PTSU]
MKIGIISLFPEMFSSIIRFGIIRQAIKKKLLKLYFYDLKDQCRKYRNIDDRPYGGGYGTVIMADPVVKSIQLAKEMIGDESRILYLSPQGRVLEQNSIRTFLDERGFILICGRYRGMDERVIQNEIHEEWSIGDYILSCGEFAAMVVIDSVARLIPGVVNCQKSIDRDSFSNGLLDHPHYTRPKTIFGLDVPSVLLSGNHQRIKVWREKQSLGQTWLKRPELLKKIHLTQRQKLLLNSFQKEYKDKEH